ncbi:NAD(P)-binding protein [Hyaloscypha hepaticicola]|uniref:NAD(P)-binding protein n=1 Tax=Hyaloscypha hepaticicola TaxID=2082293 RepID=A0A2J6Q060_9HELO|nr:NAD(P)-binding protein [Hyaloscypha hepaticicola]
MASTTDSKPLVWPITGCSAGFGKSLALLVLKAGHHVITTSRNPPCSPHLVKKVEELGGIWLPLDLTSSKEEMQKVVEQGTSKWGRIDVLVNNAGMSILGALEDFSEQEARLVMETNFFGPVKLIQTVLPQMRARHSGIIVSISSGAGVDPSPAMGMYGASKWALEGASQGFAKELASFGIRVLIVQPGAFTTNMMNAVTLTKKDASVDYKGTVVEKIVDVFRNSGNFKAPNDVEKGCQGIFEVVTGTGRGAGKEGHARLVLSQDIAQRTVEQTKRNTDALEAFREIWENTGHDSGVAKSTADIESEAGSR